MKKTIVMVAGILGLLLFCIADVGAAAPARAVRAVDMRQDDWAQLQKSKSTTIVEFRDGDQIPVSFASEGDLLETTVTGVSYVKVKRNFWLSIGTAGVELSLDGTKFRPISETVTGSFSAGAGAQSPGVPVNAISLMLEAYLK